jgi:hypothetical protein
MLTRAKPGRRAIAASSSANTRSAGLRALCRNRISASLPRSCAVRAMLISGVMPEPADRNR